MTDNRYRRLPPVNAVLERPELQALVAEHAHENVLAAIRDELETLRTQLKEGVPLDGVLSPEAVAGRVAERLRREAAPRLRRVINATGVVLHTNLGRSPLAEAAARAAYEAGRGYLNLELDLATGKRSSRQGPIREALCRLTGAESATAVNNCAAATVITLRTLAQGKEVIVSRGQLIEIGGSFRIPEIMAVGGATLREVGTTNITRLADYEKAIGPDTGALMRIHTSNYRVRGFTKEVPLADLVALGKKHKLPVVDDTGSGAQLDFGRFGLTGEPVAARSIAAGADLVLFSGDKLLGGPQAGVIVGRKALIGRIEKDPLMRAFRLDKMTLAALEATLRLYRNPEQALQEVPTLRMLGLRRQELRERAERLAVQLRAIAGVADVEVRDDEAYVGGGSLPDQPLPTVVVAVRPSELSDADFAARLRLGDPAVMARVREGRVLFDLRTVFERDESELVEAIARAMHPQISQMTQMKDRG
jgi:L-seryl-tRNA(Ser) seleniumtransferase